MDTPTTNPDYWKFDPKQYGVEDALEKMRQKIDLNEKAKLDPRIHQTKIDPKKVIKEQPMLLSMGTDWEGRHNCVLGEGDYSVITGVSKTRKTFFKSMLIASYINGDGSDNKMPFVTHRSADKIIIDIDTEQGEYHTQRAYTRVSRMVGGDYEHYHGYHWKVESPDEKIRLLENLIEVYKTDIGLIVLDGYIDFLNNFNDEKECASFQRRILEWCHKYKFHITGVLHKNPNGEKMIGHIGSVMERKAASIIALSKAEGSLTSLVTHERARDMEFDPFEIEINMGLPYKL